MPRRASREFFLTPVWPQDVRCAEHVHYGDLPCPWPNCSEGTDHAEIFGNYGGLVKERFVRREWLAFDGSVRFGWDEPDSKTGPYFAVMPLLRAEYERISKPRRPKTIYHYTTVDGLCGIIESNDLWLSDYEFLNDSAEIDHGRKLFARIVDEFLAKKTDKRSVELLSAWRHEAMERHRYRVCIACFSADGDSLSQWRGYGSGASAVAIGFDPSEYFFRDLFETRLNEVIYDPTIQRKRIEAAVNVHLEMARWDDGRPHPPGVDTFKTGSFGRCFDDLLFMKDLSFAEEREVRLVYSENKALFEREGVPRAEERFRVDRGRLIPYSTARSLFELSPYRAHDKRVYGALPISEIVIGPQESPDLLEKGVRRLCDARGLAPKIARSQVPYRPAR